MTTSSGIPFVEAYRPKHFDDIVLDPLNKQILKNIIETSYFPNLLFYGPPGTGKTTTIINLITAYQEKLHNKNKDLIIHLNASDERGIDIIRNQINYFVNSKPLFNNGMKFVILDEVDYMTKNAQQALRYLLQNYTDTVRFCLICNYISRIDEGLQNEFIRLRFNQLPREQIIKFLKNVSDTEKLNLNEVSLINIQKLFKSDLRSMLNFMQSNQDIVNFIDVSNKKTTKPTKNTSHVNNENLLNNLFIVDFKVWDELLSKLKSKENLDSIINYVYLISKKYNIDKKSIIKEVLNYIIRNNSIELNSRFLDFIENTMHLQNNNNNNILINYFLSTIGTFV